MTADNTLDYNRGTKRHQRWLFILLAIALIGMAFYPWISRVCQRFQARIQAFRTDKAVSELLSQQRSNMGIIWSNLAQDAQLSSIGTNFAKFSDGEEHIARKSVEWIYFRRQIDSIAGVTNSALDFDVFGCIAIFKTTSPAGATVITLVSVDHLKYDVDSQNEHAVKDGYDVGVKIKAIGRVRTFRSILSGRLWVLAGVDEMSFGEIYEVKHLSLATTPITVPCRISKQATANEKSCPVTLSIDGIDQHFMIEMGSNGTVMVSKNLSE